MQADLDTLQQQVWKLQKDNAALAQQVAGAGPATAGPDAALGEVRARLETLQHDVDVLRTRSEETEQRLITLSDSLRATREALEAVARSHPPPAAAPSGVVAAPGSAGVPVSGAPVGLPPVAPAGRDSPVAGASGGTAIGVDLYRLGYGDYAKGNYDLALAELQDFVRLNPADDLADDSQYLIGEVYFSQQKYPEAVAAYDRLLSEHAGGDKVAAAYLKKGLALLEMNRTADAVIQLQHVVSAYPKSEEARLARERLRALGLRER
jgi:tol-pal system protein YbgF